ncbi:elongation of very long chain fatty acids protein 4-like [Harmonia axyridis]|uniref:elongation of very long chain fatty acids protein 4-like n=1 Tax=Harmonia axyridis TaxID=115357 RepID=UPI001E275369|nr:elongation of very long chain fatty acids protein 4-like [Harmonia axyridis]
MVFMAIHEFFERHGDPRTYKYILMDSIWIPFAITIAYLIFVLHIGPRFMKNRKAYDLKKPIMIYNLLQVAMNIYLCIYVVYAFSQVAISKCIEVDYSESERGYRELNCAHLYFINKIIDCADTIFFVLKKSYRQMSFLHIYHHALMINMSWICCKIVGGGQMGWPCVFNCVVHIFMYAYYFATAYNPKYKEIQMKKYMTQLQLVQFMLVLWIFGTTLFSRCRFNKIMHGLLILEASVFLYLFVKFYYHSYMTPKPKRS